MFFETAFSSLCFLVSASSLNKIIPKPQSGGGEGGRNKQKKEYLYQ